VKSAYELAMERLQKQSPTVKLSAKQKAELAELDSVYAAKIAQCELALRDEIATAQSHGQEEEVDQLRAQLNYNRAKLKAESEEKKEAIRTTHPGPGEKEVVSHVNEV
jgi:hypothetical protein